MSKEIKFNFLNSDEKERYQKHLTLKEIGIEGQLKLKNSSVICIGAGGLGSSVLIYLASAGVGNDGGTVGFSISEKNFMGRGVGLVSSLTLSEEKVKGEFTVNNPDFNFSPFSHK